MSDGTTANGQAPAGDAAVIHIRDLAFRWQPRDPVVLALDELVVERGEQLFIEGPSGSGKSTLLGLLAGVSVARQGEVWVLEQRLDAMGAAARDHFRAHHIGYIFQMFNLIPYLSMVDNVTLPCRFSTRRRQQALQRSPSLEAEALRLLRHLDMDEPAFHRRPVTALSVGQQQRVAVARALANDPSIILADEPTGNLDLTTGEDIITLLKKLSSDREVTVISATHDYKMLNVSDKVIWIRDGRIEKIQNREELDIRTGGVEKTSGEEK